MTAEAEQLETTLGHPAVRSDGVWVLDASRMVSGPVACWLLAALGAEVIRVEAPGGDPTWRTPPFVGPDGVKNFGVLVEGTDRLGGEIDLDALVAYFGANSPVPPGPQDRITRLN